MRALGAIALVTLGVGLAGCGAASAPAPTPGSPERPLAAQIPPSQTGASGGRSNESAAGTKTASPAPGYQRLLENQTSKPRSRFTPCNLVTRAQAGAIVGRPIQALVEAPQGPTCIYRTQTGNSLISVAVQSLDFEAIKHRMANLEQVSVADHDGYCGAYGQPMLYVPLSRGRVLSIAAPCSVAKRFAATAVQQLDA